MNRRAGIAGPILGITLVMLATVMLATFVWGRAAAVEPWATTVGGPSCRWGVSATGEDQIPWVNEVAAGWFVFFGGLTDAGGPGIQIAPVISVKQDKIGEEYQDSYTIWPPLALIAPFIESHPGTLWMVGNEPDRGPDPGEVSSGQDDTFPVIYARAYHDLYTFIKQIDPTALVANAGLVQVTPGRLQYLDLMWQSYQAQYGEPMPVDVWNMHVYVMPEAELDGTPNGIAGVALGTDAALAKRGPGATSDQCVLDEIYCYAEHDDVNIFEHQARAMRRWMLDHGQQQKPLILSEFSILYPCTDVVQGVCGYLRDEFGNDFDAQRVQNYFQATTDRLENLTDPVIGNPLDGGRLVQQWAWFSIATTTQVGDVSDLVQKDGSSGQLVGLNELGQAYLAKASSASTYVNLALAPVRAVTAWTSPPSGKADADLSVTVANNGSLTFSGAITVTFYADEGLTQVIDQVNLPANGGNIPKLIGCASGTVTVSATWPGLASGLHRFWVQVEGQGELVPGQGSAADNVAESFVLVDPARTWLPAAR
jgi:hypothetical protein